MTTRLDVQKAWELWKRHRDTECVAMANAEPCDCEDEDTWDRFEEALDRYLSERQPPDDGSMDCSCGRVTLDFFTGTHSMLTKEGERFISTNHRRDRCDREIVPVEAPAAPKEEE